MLTFVSSLNSKKLDINLTLLFVVICLAYHTFSATWYSVSLHRKLAIKVKVYLPLFMAVMPAAGFGFGLLTGILFKPMAGNFSITAGGLLLALIGLKIMYESFKFYPEERVILTDTLKSALLLALSGSMNVFFGGFALGLAGFPVLMPMALLFGVSLVYTLAGILLGNAHGYKTMPARLGILAGSLIVFFSIRMLY